MDKPSYIYYLSIAFTLLIGLKSIPLKASWSTVDGLPQTYEMKDCWCSETGEDIVVVGTLPYHYDSEVWREMWTGQVLGMTCIWGTSIDNLYGGGSFLHHWDGSFWHPVHEVPEDIREIWGSDGDNIYVATSEGLHYWNGETWSDMNLYAAASGIWGSSPEDVFLISGQSIQHYDGENFTEMDHPAYDGLYGIHGTGPDDVYAVGASGIILHYDGDYWRLMNSGYSSWLNSVWCAGPNDVYALGSDLLHYDGVQWTVIDETPGTGLCGTSGNNLYYVGDMGSFYHWDGDKVTGLDRLTTGNLISTIYKGPDDIYLGSSDGLFHNDGESWERVSPAESFVRMIELDNGDMYGIGGGYIRRWDGVEFQDLAKPVGEIAFGWLWGTEPDNILISGGVTGPGGYGCFWRYDGSEVTLISGDYLHVGPMWGESIDDIYAVNHDGFIYHYDGETLTQIFGDWSWDYSFYDIWGSSSNDIYVVGWPGLIFHFDGVEWAQMPTVEIDALQKIEMLPSGDLVIVSSDGRFLYWDCEQWVGVESGTTLNTYTAAGESLNDLTLFGQYGTMLHWDGMDLGVRLLPSNTEFNKRWPCWLRGYLYNPGDAMEDVPVLIFLDFFGEFFFWPGWEPFDASNFSVERMDVNHGVNTFDVIPPFEMPDDLEPSHMNGFRFYGAMLNDDMTEILGDFDVVTISYSVH